MRPLLVALAVVLALPALAHAKPREQRPKSAAVEHLATVPAPEAVSANFKRYADGKTYMFVSALSGLYVYDVTNGAAPQRVSVLPMPHFQNEDVSLAGKRLLISTDGGLSGGFLFEIDISDPANPRPARAIKLEPFGEGHTASCIDPSCRWVWVAGDQVTSGIAVLDLGKAPMHEVAGVGIDNDPGLWTFGFFPIPKSEVAVGSIDRGNLADPSDDPDIREFGWSTHDVHVDKAGVAWVAGGDGTIGFDVRNYPQAGGPLNPPIAARTGEAALNDEDAFDGPTNPANPGAETTYDPENAKDTVNDFIHHNALRPGGGETVLIAEEDLYNRRVSNMPGGCEVQGSFQTWRVASGKLQLLDTWKTEFNELLADADQDPWGGDIVPTMGLCSAHYFDERNGLVAIAWYEQGVRLLDIEDPTSIEQVGYWMGTGGATWATYWSPTAKDIVYAVDPKRGVDVLRVKRRAAQQVDAPILPSWTAGQKSFGKSYPGLGFICRVR